MTNWCVLSNTILQLEPANKKSSPKYGAACTISADSDGSDDGNKCPMVMQFFGDRFVISSCCLHDNARIFTEREDVMRQTLQI